MFVIRQRMCYHRGREEERWSGVFRHSPDPPQPTWTRLERIQQLGVDGEDPGKSVSSRWQVTSHPWFRSCGSRGKERAYEAILLR